MSVRSKEHHYVPKVLQRQFASEENEQTIWYAKKEGRKGYRSPVLKQIEKAFVRRNYYTVLRNDQLSDVIEREYYGKIDNYLGELLPDVVSSLCRGLAPTFSGDRLQSLREVVVAMLLRTPDFANKYDDVQTGRDIVEATLAKASLSPDDPDRVDLLKQMNDDGRLREIGRTARVGAITARPDRTLQTLEEFSVRWAVSEGKHSFVLSSEMVYRIGNGGSNGLSNPKTELWLPIHPKFTLVLLRDPENNIPLRIKGTANHIRLVNEYAIDGSLEVASHSRNLIESLTKKKAVIHQNPTDLKMRNLSRTNCSKLCMQTYSTTGSLLLRSKKNPPKAYGTKRGYSVRDT